MGTKSDDDRVARRWGYLSAAVVVLGRTGHRLLMRLRWSESYTVDYQRQQTPW